MFRGVTRAEQRIMLGLCLLIAGSLGFQVWNRQQSGPRPVEFSGSFSQHPPGELMLSPPTAVQSVAGTPTATSGLVDLNSAGLKELESLPGIGPTRAAAILADREAKGPFRSVTDLDRVAGIGPKSLESLAALVYVEPQAAPAHLPTAAPTPVPPPAGTPPPAQPATPPPTPAAPQVININTATVEELMALEGIGEKIAARIVADRITNGPFRRIEDLDRVKGIGPKTLDANRHRLRVR